MSLKQKTGSCIKQHSVAQGSTTTKSVCLSCSTGVWTPSEESCSSVWLLSVVNSVVKLHHYSVFVNLAPNREMLYFPCEQPLQEVFFSGKGGICGWRTSVTSATFQMGLCLPTICS